MTGKEALIEGKDPIENMLQAAHNLATARASLDDLLQGEGMDQEAVIEAVHNVAVAGTELNDLRYGHIFETDTSGSHIRGPQSQYSLFPVGQASLVHGKRLREIPPESILDKSTQELLEKIEPTEEEPFVVDSCYIEDESDWLLDINLDYMSEGDILKHILAKGDEPEIGLEFTSYAKARFKRGKDWRFDVDHAWMNPNPPEKPKSFTYLSLVIPIGDLRNWDVREYREGVEISRWVGREALEGATA